MIYITKDNISVVSENISNSLSQLSTYNLAQIQKSIVNQFGYKDWFSFKQSQKKKNNNNLFHIFTLDEIMKLLITNYDMLMLGIIKFEDKTEHIPTKLTNIVQQYSLDKTKTFSNFVNYVSKNNIPHFNQKRLDMLSYIENNDFIFFNMEWFNQWGYGEKSTANVLNSQLINNIPLAFYSLFNHKKYLEYFHQAHFINQNIKMSITEFLKYTFKSIFKKEIDIRNYFLDILEYKYSVIANTSLLMENFTIHQQTTYCLTEKQIKNISKHLSNKQNVTTNFIENLLKRYTFEQIDFNDHRISNISLEPLKLFISYSDIRRDFTTKDYNDLLENIEFLYNSHSHESFFEFNKHFNIATLNKIEKINITLFKKEWLNTDPFYTHKPFRHIKSYIKNNQNFYISWLNDQTFINFFNHVYLLLNRDITLIDLILYTAFMSNIDASVELIKLYLDILNNPYSKEISEQF
jgi:hypothetical protein